MSRNKLSCRNRSRKQVFGATRRIAFLAGAWGKRGLPITMSIMFAMVFSMAMPRHADSGTALASSLHFALGAAAYLVWAPLANTLLKGVMATILGTAELRRVAGGGLLALGLAGGLGMWLGR